MVPAFQTSTGNLSALAEVVLKAQGAYKTGLFGTGAFSENHDQPRFPSLTNDTAVSRFVVGDKHVLTRIQEDQERHYLPFHSRWHPHPLLRCVGGPTPSRQVALMHPQVRNKVTPEVVTPPIAKRKSSHHVGSVLGLNLP